jgi:hypothetical protein
MAVKKEITLPYNWRKQITQNLAQQGIAINEQKVYDAIRGRVADPHLVRKVLKARAAVARRHAAYTRLLQRAACIFLPCFWLL